MSQPNTKSTSIKTPEYTYSANGSLNTSQADVDLESADDLNLRFHSAVRDCPTFENFCRRLAQIIIHETDCLALVLATSDESGSFSKHQSMTSESAAVWELIQDDGIRVISAAAESQQTSYAEIKNPAGHQIIAVPVVFQQRTEFVLCGCCSITQKSSERQRWLLVMAAQALNQWCQQHQIIRNGELSKRLSESLQLTALMARCTTKRDGYFTVVNQLRNMLAASQVALFVQTKRTNGLVAISDVELLDVQSEANREIQSACEPACRYKKAFDVETSTDSNPENEPLLKYCRRHNWTTCLNLPIQNSRQEVIGSLLIAWNSTQPDRERLIQSLTPICTVVADQLGFIERADRRLHEIAIHQFQETCKKRWVHVMTAFIVTLLIAFCVPVPYRINCDTQLQPIKRRFVAAPYDGILNEPLVENGEIVSKNQVLATMDGRKLRMELSGLEAELKGAKKRSESYRVTGEIAQSQIAISEMRRISSEIAILRQRSENLEIRSPIDGIVISGDLDKAEGIPLELGQTLFEIGPLDKMLAEVGIPESEIQYAQPGMKVTLKLDAIPFQTFTGTVARIHPRATLVNDESVFLAEIELDNSSGSLRPGLNGIAKITSHSHPLGWNLFHGAWESIRHWLVW